MNPASTRLPNLHVKGRLMSGSEIERTLVRLAHQIVEKNNGVENLVLVGIKRRGVPLASRLAALTDVLTITLHPLGLFLFLPANLLWAISRYRRHRPIAIRRGQGARMGAMMGVLCFAFFFAFFLVRVSFQRAEYRDVVISQIHQISAQNPDPQAQQMLQWFATPEGLIAYTAIALVTILLVCLAVGISSGAIAIALRNNQKRF